MRKWVLILLLICGIVSWAGAVTPITSIGSNPYYSTTLFPQDLLLREGNYFFYSPQYRNSPFWGDIDQQSNKPQTGNDYTITGVEIMRNGGTFKHNGTVHSVLNNIGYAFRVNDRMMADIEIDGNVDMLINHAEGNFTGNTYPDGKTIPFDYTMGHTLGYVTTRALIATYFRGHPVGLKCEGGMQNTVRLSKSLFFSKYAMINDSTYDENDLVEYSMEGDHARAFWGWTIPGCNHIFGEHGTQGDSWFQNRYALGPVYHINLLGAVTTPQMRAGGQFRMIYGHQDQYYWKSVEDTVYGNDVQLTERYIGSYLKDDMAQLTWLNEGRLFSNFVLRSADRYSLNTFVSLRYADSSSGSALADNLDAVNGSKDRKRSLELECYPNINTKLGGFLNYIDVAGLFAYKYSRYSNTRETWINGGVVETYQTGRLQEEWGNVWENFSYANESVFDVGADIASMFPIFTDGRHRLYLNLRLVGDVRFTWQSKYFGESVANGSTIDFDVNNIRKNYSREMIFNTAIMLQYALGPMQLRFQFTKPVLYSILPRTSVTDADGNEQDGYPLQRSPQLISQEGPRIQFYGSYDIVLPFAKR